MPLKGWTTFFLGHTSRKYKKNTMIWLTYIVNINMMFHHLYKYHFRTSAQATICCEGSSSVVQFGKASLMPVDCRTDSSAAFSSSTESCFAGFQAGGFSWTKKRVEMILYYNITVFKIYIFLVSSMFSLICCCLGCGFVVPCLMPLFGGMGGQVQLFSIDHIGRRKNK